MGGEWGRQQSKQKVRNTGGNTGYSGRTWDRKKGVESNKMKHSCMKTLNGNLLLCNIIYKLNHDKSQMMA